MRTYTAVCDGWAEDWDVILPGPVVHTVRVVDGLTQTRNDLQNRDSNRDSNKEAGFACQCPFPAIRCDMYTLPLLLRPYCLVLHL
jgi:hypothetical protein